MVSQTLKIQKSIICLAAILAPFCAFSNTYAEKDEPNKVFLTRNNFVEYNYTYTRLSNNLKKEVNGK